MIIIAYIPFLIALIGLLVYMLATNAKAQELGRIMFATGILVTMFTMASKVLRLG